MRWLGLISLLGFIVIALFWSSGDVRRSPGVLIADEPEQTQVLRPTPWLMKNYRITPLATYRIRGRVLLTEHYWFGRETDLSPLDLTLGWRLMSNQDVLDQLRLYSQHRAYIWEARGDRLPAREEDITSHSANMHLIPADGNVAATLKSVRRGDLVDLGGYLVEADAPDGWRWRSSLSRTDTGQGACELMWVVSASTL